MFNKNNRIKELEELVSRLEKQCNEKDTEIQKLCNNNREVQKQCEEKYRKLMEMKGIKEENEIMRKYYKLDEEPSPDVQAKVMADLKVHDMEQKLMLEKLDELKRDLARCQSIPSNIVYYPHYRY